VINEESDRLNRFIEGLSTPDRAEPSPLRSTTVDAIVRAGLMRAETLTRHHRVVVEIADDVPKIAVDASAMTEVMYILVDNASKYAPVGSAIAVRATRTENDAAVNIWVSDDGPGIPPELREQVFERFFRVPQREPVDPRRSGAGLGLSIARRLVEAQGGQIWIDDGDGHGTVVAVTLPAVTESDEAPVQAPAAAMSAQ
jgi:two-component system sensor histidine kinase KdpD